MNTTLSTHTSRPVEVVAERWVEWDSPPKTVCFERVHGKRAKTGIGSPHIHSSPSIREAVSNFEFVEVVDWIVNARDGSFIEVLTDEEFLMKYQRGRP